MKRQISSVFTAHAKLFIIFFFLSFFFSKSSRLMNDVGKLLWALTSYIIFVLVHLYLRLSENALPCDFHKHWRFQYIVRHHFLFMIWSVKLRILSVTWLHDGCTIDGLLRVPCCVLLVILAVMHWWPLLLTSTVVCMQHVVLLQGIIYTSSLYFLKA